MARDQIFISYSHKDKKWLDKLQLMLAPLKRKAKIKVWADTQIVPGKKWKEEIQRALKSTKVAVLLVSPDFLASEFIHNNELPPLLAASEEEGLTILWVLVRDCGYQWTVIADYQAAYSLDKPLYQLKAPQQETALVKIVKRIEEAWSSEKKSDKLEEFGKPSIKKRVLLIPRIFISYEPSDANNLAKKLYEIFDQNGLTVWQDLNKVNDDDWRQQIKEAIQKTEYVLLVLTSQALHSEKTHREWWFAGLDHRLGHVPPTDTELWAVPTLQKLENQQLGLVGWALPTRWWPKR